MVHRPMRVGTVRAFVVVGPVRADHDWITPFVFICVVAAPICLERPQHTKLGCVTAE